MERSAAHDRDADEGGRRRVAPGRRCAKAAHTGDPRGDRRSAAPTRQSAMSTKTAGNAGSRNRITTSPRKPRRADTRRPRAQPGATAATAIGLTLVGETGSRRTRAAAWTSDLRRAMTSTTARWPTRWRARRDRRCCRSPIAAAIHRGRYAPGQSAGIRAGVRPPSNSKRRAKGPGGRRVEAWATAAAIASDRHARLGRVAMASEATSPAPNAARACGRCASTSARVHHAAAGTSDITCVDWRSQIGHTARSTAAMTPTTSPPVCRPRRKVTQMPRPARSGTTT